MTAQKEPYGGCKHSRKNPKDCIRDFCVHSRRKEWNSGHCEGADRCPDYEDHIDEPETPHSEQMYLISESQIMKWLELYYSAKDIAAEIRSRPLPAPAPEETGMSKYFLEPVVPKPTPTFEERAKAAIMDLEKRVNSLEARQRAIDVTHHAEEFAKARAYDQLKDEGRI